VKAVHREIGRLGEMSRGDFWRDDSWLWIPALATARPEWQDV